jgi:hypothetical protein
MARERNILAKLEDRIRRLEDRADLHDLVAAYFLAVDDDQYETVAQCFTEDVHFVASGFDGDSGRGAVIAFLRSARAGMGQTVHTPNYVQLHFINDDEATGVVGAHLELGLGDKTYFGAVRYQDRYRRVDDRWQIARREMQAIHFAPWSEVEKSLTTQFNVRWPATDPLPSDCPRGNFL